MKDSLDMNVSRDPEAEAAKHLRNHFAALAMQGMLAGWEEYHRMPQRGEVENATKLARLAYQIADAMMAESQRKP